MQARLRLVTATEVQRAPMPGPAEHVANALQLLIAHESKHATVWEFSGELRAAESLLFRALFQLGAELPFVDAE